MAVKNVKKKKREMTISDLSKKIDALAASTEKGFKLVDEKFKLVDEKFKLVDERMEKGFRKADERLEAAINDLALIVGKGFEHVDRRIDSLEQGQDDIKIRLDNVAYRFELIELQKRVGILERKIR